jgi:hypothetical protein
MKNPKRQKLKLLSLSLFSFLLLQACQQQKLFKVQQNKQSVTISTSNYQLIVQKAGFRYSFKSPDGKIIAPAHQNSGIQIAEKGKSLSNIQSSHLSKRSEKSVTFSAKTENGLRHLLKSGLRSTLYGCK